MAISPEWLRSPLRRWTLAILALSCVDVVETAIGLRLGGREANPIAASILLHHSFLLVIGYKLLSVVIAMCLVYWLHRVDPDGHPARVSRWTSIFVVVCPTLSNLMFLIATLHHIPVHAHQFSVR